MTLHNAKGLEFPIVFMIGCEDGVFPHARAIDEGDVEEERRLAYVAITRAHARPLHHLRAAPQRVFGARDAGLRSRFLDEIPPELTDAASDAGGRRGRRRRGRARRGRGAVGGRRRRPATRRRAGGRCSGSATTSSTPPSARAS